MRSDNKRMTMNVHELAQALGISLPKAYELTKQDGFPVIRVGKRLIIPIDALQAWLLKSVGACGSEAGQ